MQIQIVVCTACGKCIRVNTKKNVANVMDSVGKIKFGVLMGGDIFSVQWYISNPIMCLIFLIILLLFNVCLSTRIKNDYHMNVSVFTKFIKVLHACKLKRMYIADSLSYNRGLKY